MNTRFIPIFYKQSHSGKSQEPLQPKALHQLLGFFRLRRVRQDSVRVQPTVRVPQIPGDDGGAVEAYAYPLDAVTIEDSVFFRNRAEPGRAGAVFIHADLTVRVARTAFVDNVASGVGGAIWADGSAEYGYKTALKDARPVALFRIGAIHLLNHDPAAARAAWENVVQAYPQSLAAELVQDLNLTSFDGSLSQWCETLANQQALTMDGYRRDFLDQYPTNEFDWLPLCHPRLRLPLHSWTQAAPLADQFAVLGMPWQPISAAYDLNGDGISDPLGVVDWLGIYTPWAFLSTADGYQPLYVMQPWSINTPLATLTDPSYSFERPTTATITDLDADGAPEWLFDNLYRFNLAAWHGDRFQPNSISFSHSSSSFSATLTLAPQPDGTQRIVADLLPRDGRQANPSRFEYALRADTLQQSDPAPITAYRDGFQNSAYVALFGLNDPPQALQLLAADPALPGIWHQHERQVLQALALEYSGQPAAAQRLLAEVASATPPTGWSRFARERR